VANRLLAIATPVATLAVTVDAVRLAHGEMGQPWTVMVGSALFVLSLQVNLLIAADLHQRTSQR
jgi:hypothetical protein